MSPESEAFWIKEQRTSDTTGSGPDGVEEGDAQRPEQLLATEAIRELAEEERSYAAAGDIHRASEPMSKTSRPP
jgi:hypothetical protein